MGILLAENNNRKPQTEANSFLLCKCPKIGSSGLVQRLCSPKPTRTQFFPAFCSTFRCSPGRHSLRRASTVTCLRQEKGGVEKGRRRQRMQANSLLRKFTKITHDSFFFFFLASTSHTYLQGRLGNAGYVPSWSCYYCEKRVKTYWGTSYLYHAICVILNTLCH